MAEISDSKSFISQVSGLTSEGINPNTSNLDELSSEDILRKMNAEDATVASAVAGAIVQIAAAVDAIVDSFKAGGRLIYMGAGTSGRLGVLDAAECPPTFSVPNSMVVACIAGGKSAMFTAVEGAEDSKVLAIEDLQGLNITANDTVVGIAASGRTPYAISAVDYANKVGAVSVGISCNANSTLLTNAKIAICAQVGAEVISGSTRLKSGTAQKLILNMLSTASMVKLGKVHGNLMIDVNPSNKKLKARAVNIVMQVTDCSAQVAQDTLQSANFNVKLACLVLLSGLTPEQASVKLTQANGILRDALKPTS